MTPFTQNEMDFLSECLDVIERGLATGDINAAGLIGAAAMLTTGRRALEQTGDHKEFINRMWEVERSCFRKAMASQNVFGSQAVA